MQKRTIILIDDDVAIPDALKTLPEQEDIRRLLRSNEEPRYITIVLLIVNH